MAVDQRTAIAPEQSLFEVAIQQFNIASEVIGLDDGLPSSLGCGTWGGNITTENVNARHFVNLTWVSRTITPTPADPEEDPRSNVLFDNRQARRWLGVRPLPVGSRKVLEPEHRVSGEVVDGLHGTCRFILQEE